MVTERRIPSGADVHLLTEMVDIIALREGKVLMFKDDEGTHYLILAQDTMWLDMGQDCPGWIEA